MSLPRVSGVSKTICQKRNGTHWMQEGGDTSSVRRFASVRSENTLTGSKQVDGATSSTDMTEQLPDLYKGWQYTEGVRVS